VDTERNGCLDGGDVACDKSARTLSERAHCPYGEAELEAEAAEQDAAIRAGKSGGLPAHRLHRFRIATLPAKDDQRSSRLIAAATAVLRRKLLRARRRVAFLALATRPAAATRPLSAQVGSLAARVGCSKRLDGQ